MVDQPTTRISIEDIGARALRSWWFVGIVSGVVLGILVLASWPWWFNRFTLTTTTRIVEFSAAAPAVHGIGLQLPKNREIQVFGAYVANLPPELRTLADTPVSIRLIASNVTLQSVSLPSGAGLIVHMMSDGEIDLGVLNGGGISLALSGKIERIDDRGQRIAIAETARAIVWNIRPAERNDPARLVLPLGAVPITLFNQPISNFRFRLPQPTGDDSRTFQSEVITGELKLLDTSTTITLQPRELILLEDGSRFLSRLEVLDKAIAVDIAGEARRISIGPPRPGLPFRLDRDLTPSVLSYLVGQHELKLAWGVALAVLGALWKARQWALKWGG
jgi:hypothetical protein